MRTYIVDNKFYIEGGETSCGYPIVISLSYIKECVKSLKTLGFNIGSISARFHWFDENTEALLYDLYEGTYYTDKYLDLELGTRTVTHEYDNRQVKFAVNKDNSYEYEGVWRYYYLNRITKVRINFY